VGAPPIVEQRQAAASMIAPVYSKDLIVALTFIANFHLIIDLFLNTNSEGVEYIRTISCNKL
jgi:hypothetical protein